MPPLTRALVMADGGNVGLSLEGRKYPSAILSFVSRVRRSGHSRPWSRGRRRSHFHAPYAATVLTPATMKPRRESLRASRSTSRSLMSHLGNLANFVADDHRSEVVPSGLDNLPDMDQEKSD